MVKDADEIALLALAAHAADRVVAPDRGGPARRADRGRRRPRGPRAARRRGPRRRPISRSSRAGPNSASPHHEASDRVIEAGEPIVLDIGGALGGYGSDITRTVWVTGGDPRRARTREFRHLFSACSDAQAAATRGAARASPCERIDAAAARNHRSRRLRRGFFHRPGHGIGLEGHEDPYLVAGNAEPLARGMAFSVEPGIYLEGATGPGSRTSWCAAMPAPIVLNEAPRELLVVDG